MIFSLLTFLTALSLAAVAGWFSIVGIMTIYAGAPIFAAVLGIVTECGKLVTISWLYRNWNDCTWRLKLPLIYFTIALMAITSIGVFGFLSKAHLEQNSSTIDNSARVEQLNRQIDREKAIIADSEKLVAQLDSTVNSFLGKDRADRSLAVRRSQAPQREQLRKEIAEAQARIDKLSEEKFKYESEIRKLELEVGPIRYVAEMMYGKDGDGKSNLESAVKIFTLLIVSTLDPLASVLLIAANSSWQRRKKKDVAKEEVAEAEDSKTKEVPWDNQSEGINEDLPLSETVTVWPEIKISLDEDLVSEKTWKNIPDKGSLQTEMHNPETMHIPSEEVEKSNKEVGLPVRVEHGSDNVHLPDTQLSKEPAAPASVESLPEESHDLNTPWAQQKDVLSGILGTPAHFIPEKVKTVPETKKIVVKDSKENKYPSISSWIDKFGGQDGKRTRKVD